MLDHPMARGLDWMVSGPHGAVERLQQDRTGMLDTPHPEPVDGIDDIGHVDVGFAGADHDGTSPVLRIPNSTSRPWISFFSASVSMSLSVANWMLARISSSRSMRRRLR